MRKRIFFLSILSLFLITGCTRIDKNSVDYKNQVTTIINNNTPVNRVSTGYKYYLPKGIVLTLDNDFNQEFKIYNTNMFLYVDIVSYYYKNVLNFNESAQYNYYYEKIDSNNKTGFIGINLENDKYFVKIVYNYAKIEVYTSKEYLNNTIIYATIILNSLDYNDVLIKKIIEENSIYASEITYELDKPEGSESNFSQYLKEYVQIDESTVELPDE